MHSLAWRPCLGPAVHYWVRQGNGRLSFCQSCRLEMQNMIPLSPLHLLLLLIQVASLPMHKSLRYEVESLNSPVLIPPPTHHQLWWKKKRKKKVCLWSSDPCQAWVLCQSANPSPLPASPSDSVLMILEAVRARAHHTSHKALSWVSFSPQSATQSVVDSA